jgi:hypothetical protein
VSLSFKLVEMVINENYLPHCQSKVHLRDTILQILSSTIHVDASYQISVHMAKQFQRRRFFRNRPIRNKNCMRWPCFLTDRDEMSNLNRGHSINDSHQVSIYGRSSLKSTHFVMIHYQTWPPQAILVSDWPI